MSGWKAAERVKASDLAVGDFVEVFPTQLGLRGLRIESGIKAVERLSGAFRVVGSARGAREDGVRVEFLSGVAIVVPPVAELVARVQVRA